jgi:transcriptional regulator with XRE-family HTH domain
MPPVYLQECISVKGSLATRRDAGAYALIAGVEERDRTAVREFLLRAAEHAGTDLSNLARLAGLSPSTVTRFVNGDSRYLPTTRTLTKIAAASGLGTPLQLAEAAALRGADQRRDRRTAQWMALINNLPPSIENNLFEALRGMIDTGFPPQLANEPRKSGRRRRHA